MRPTSDDGIGPTPHDKRPNRLSSGLSATEKLVATPNLDAETRFANLEKECSDARARIARLEEAYASFSESQHNRIETTSKKTRNGKERTYDSVADAESQVSELLRMTSLRTA